MTAVRWRPHGAASPIPQISLGGTPSGWSIKIRVALNMIQWMRYGCRP